VTGAGPWLCTGISWRGGRPALTMTDRDGREVSRALVLDAWFGVHIAGPRMCVGVRRHDVRACPFRTSLPPTARLVQCDACAAADPGRMLARDAIVDDRRFRLYLASFGNGPLKVGISAAERGSERLLEQGALAFTWLAEGPHLAIRATEATVSGARIATERRRRDSKIAGWWHPDTAADRRDTLLTAAQRAQSLRTWPVSADPVEPSVVDHVEVYGLNRLHTPPGQLPGQVPGQVPGELEDIDVIDHLSDGAQVAGQVRAVIGTELVLHGGGHHASDRLLILGGRTLAGWSIAPATAPSDVPSGHPVGFTVKAVRHGAAGSAEPTLF